MTQDCTVAPAHFQGTPYRGAHHSGRSRPGPPYAPPAGGWSAETLSGKDRSVLSLLDQQGIRPLPCRPMPQPTGYTIALLQGLPVQDGRVGEVNTEPHIAPGAIDPALHLAIALGPVAPAQPYLETYLQGEILHPPVPFRPAGRIPAHHHLGVAVQTVEQVVYVATSHNEGMGRDGGLVSFLLILYGVLGGLCIKPIALLCLNTRLIAGFHVEVR